jgi:exodeoxyribonuclease V alpha subunit
MPCSTRVLSGYAQALSRLWQQPGDAALEDAVWRAWDAFRLLCAGHAGPWGTRALNQRAVQALRRALPQAAPTALGQALLVTRNQGALRQRRHPLAAAHARRRPLAGAAA